VVTVTLAVHAPEAEGPVDSVQDVPVDLAPAGQVASAAVVAEAVEPVAVAQVGEEDRFVYQRMHL